MNTGYIKPVLLPRCNIFQKGTNLMGQKVTLADVAARAGCSPTMVSYVLRNGESGKSAPATRKRIYAAVKELGYRVDYAARALRYGDSRMIGVLLPRIGGYVYELLTALDKSIHQAGYMPLCSFFDTVPDFRKSCAEAMEKMLSMNVAAIISSTRGIVAPTATPVIIWGNKMEDRDCVYPDKAGYGQEVIERVWNLGHRKIGMAGLLDDVRYVPMVEFLQKQNAFSSEYMFKSPGVQERGSAVLEYFMALPEMPSVIICHSDELALGVIRVAHLKGIDVPEKLSVVGFDNLRAGAMMLPSLATYDQNFELMAQKLTEVTLNRIKNPELSLQQLAIPVEFILGESLSIYSS